MESKVKSGFITVKDKSIYYELINPELLNQEVPLLVFLHEGLGSCAQWKDFPASLSAGLKFPALMYDRYGYGKSEKIVEDRNLYYLEQEAIEWLPKIFTALSLDDYKKILIGHSDGGSISLIYPSVYPKNVIGIISEAAHLFNEDKAYENLLTTRDKYRTGPLKQKLEKYHGDNTDRMFNSWIDMWLSDNFRKWNIESYLPGICCPILAIQGKEDEFGTFKQLELIRDNTKTRTEILFIDKCKHVPHQQARKIVEKEMIKFIAGL